MSALAAFCGLKPDIAPCPKSANSGHREWKTSRDERLSRLHRLIADNVLADRIDLTGAYATVHALTLGDGLL
jgi:hypothetical protein